MIKDNSMFEALIPRFPDYELIDSGDFEKLERFGRYVVRRPEPQAIWRRTLSEEEWRRAADASFLRDTRSEERGEWRLGPEMPSRWTVDYVYKGMRLGMRGGSDRHDHIFINYQTLTYYEKIFSFISNLYWVVFVRSFIFTIQLCTRF